MSLFDRDGRQADFPASGNPSQIGGYVPAHMRFSNPTGNNGVAHGEGSERHRQAVCSEEPGSACEAVQILGGAGFLRGGVVERIYREVKVNAIGGGSEKIMKGLAARYLS